MLTGTLEVQQLAGAAQPTLVILAAPPSNHKIAEWIESKGPERSLHSNPPAMVRSTFHYTRLLGSDPQLYGLLLTWFPP